MKDKQTQPVSHVTRNNNNNNKINNNNNNNNNNNLALNDVTMKNGKRETTEIIKQLNQESIRTLEREEKLRVLGDIGSGHYQTNIN